MLTTITPEQSLLLLLKLNMLCLTVGTARNSLNQKIVWLVILLTTVVCIMPMVAVRFIKADLYPTHTDKVTT